MALAAASPGPLGAALVAKAAALLHAPEADVAALVQGQGCTTMAAVKQAYFHARRQALAASPRDAGEWMQNLQDLLERKPAHADVADLVAQELAQAIEGAYRLPLEDIDLGKAQPLFEATLAWSSQGSKQVLLRIHRAATSLMIRLILVNSPDAAMSSTIGLTGSCHPLVAVLRTLWAANAYLVLQDEHEPRDVNVSGDMSISNIMQVSMDKEEVKNVFLANYEACFGALESLFLLPGCVGKTSTEEKRALRGMMTHVIMAFPLAKDFDPEDRMHNLVYDLCFVGFANDASACSALWSGAYKSLRDVLFTEVPLPRRLKAYANVAAGAAGSKSVLDVLARQGTPVHDLVRMPSMAVSLARLLAALYQISANVAKPAVVNLCAALPLVADDDDVSAIAAALSNLCRLHADAVLPCFSVLSARAEMRHAFGNPLLGVLNERCPDSNALLLVLQLAKSAGYTSALHLDLFAFALTLSHFEKDPALASQALASLPRVPETGWFDFSPLVRALDSPEVVLAAVQAFERIAALSRKPDWAVQLAANQSAVLAIARLVPSRGADLLQSLLLALRKSGGPSLLGVLDTAMDLVLGWLTEALSQGDVSVVSLLICAAKCEPGFCARCMPTVAPYVLQLLNPEVGVQKQDIRLYERALCLAWTVAKSGAGILTEEHYSWLSLDGAIGPNADAVQIAAVAHALQLAALILPEARGRLPSPLAKLPALAKAAGAPLPANTDLFKRQFPDEEEDFGAAFTYNVELMAECRVPQPLLQQACDAGLFESFTRALRLLVQSWTGLVTKLLLQPSKRDPSELASLINATCDALVASAESSSWLLRDLAKAIFVLANKLASMGSLLVVPSLYSALASVLRWEGEDEAIESLCASLLAVKSDSGPVVEAAQVAELALAGLMRLPSSTGTNSNNSNAARSSDALLMVLSATIDAASPECLLDTLGRVWNNQWIVEGPKRARLVDEKRLERTLVVLGRASRNARTRRYLVHLGVVPRLASLSLGETGWVASIALVTELAKDSPFEVAEFCARNADRFIEALRVLDGEGAHETFRLCEISVATRIVVLLGKLPPSLVGAALRSQVSRLFSMAVDGEDASRVQGFLEEFADFATCVTEAKSYHGPPPRLVKRAEAVSDEERKLNSEAAYQARPSMSPRPVVRSPSASAAVLPPAAITRFHVAVERAIAQLVLAVLVNSPPAATVPAQAARDQPDALTILSLLRWSKASLRRAVHMGEPNALVGQVTAVALMRLLECLENVEVQQGPSWKQTNHGKQLVKSLLGKASLAQSLVGHHFAEGSGLDAAIVDACKLRLANLLGSSGKVGDSPIKALPATRATSSSSVLASPSTLVSQRGTSSSLVWLSAEPASLTLWLDAMQGGFSTVLVDIKPRLVDTSCADRFLQRNPDWRARVDELERKALQGDAGARYELFAAASSSTRVLAEEVLGIRATLTAEAERAGGLHRVCLGGIGFGAALAIFVAAQCAVEGNALGALFAVAPGPVPDAEVLARLPKDAAWPLRTFLVAQPTDAQASALLAGMRCVGLPHVHGAEASESSSVFSVEQAALLEGVLRML